MSTIDEVKRRLRKVPGFTPAPVEPKALDLNAVHDAVIAECRVGRCWLWGIADAVAGYLKTQDRAVVEPVVRQLQSRGLIRPEDPKGDWEKFSFWFVEPF